jgi:hypothetical protein
MRHGKAAVVVLGVVVFWFAGTLRPQTEADWDWTNKQFGPTLDALMPLQGHGGVYVSYRANRDLYTSTPEYWFMIGREPNESRPGFGLRSYLSAHVRVAQPVSIYDQLMTIHHNEPAIQDTATIQKRIKLQNWDFSEMDCPAVKKQLDKLKNLPARLPDINGDRIILHPMIHAFYISGADGNVTMFLADDSNPLVQWAQETRRAFDACGKPR